MKASVFFVLLILSGACQTKKDDIIGALPHSREQFIKSEENPTTQSKVRLGRQLFYENALSLDSSISCASCHIQQFAFADTARVSRGVAGAFGVRNAPTLANVAFRKNFFFEGGVKTIERAVHPPVFADFEMHMNVADLEKRLRNDTQYLRLFQEAFDTLPNYKGVIFALAAFQRTLISLNAPFDHFFVGDSSAMSEQELRGWKVFKSPKTNCAKCHVPPFFTDDQFHNIGLYQNYSDFGRYRLTLKNGDQGKMRTPTLRNIAQTAPYMHDGSVKTLGEVIDFYSSGGRNHPNKSSFIKPFELTENEKQDLIAFLQALTDSTFLANPAFSNPKLRAQ